jgi:Caulimovirus viroplasmin
MGKVYAVRTGRKTGIFNSWNEVVGLVSGFPGAKHKSFASVKEATAWLQAPDEASIGRGASSSHGPGKGISHEVNDRPPGALSCQAPNMYALVNGSTSNGDFKRSQDMHLRMLGKSSRLFRSGVAHCLMVGNHL